MIAALKGSYPVQTLCQVLGYPRSSCYYQPVTRDEQVVVPAMEAILLRWPFYGYRRVQHQLRRQGLQVGERLVRRLLHRLGGSRQVGRVPPRTTDSQHTHPRYPNRLRGLPITYPDQVWVADITYLRLGRRFIYLAVVLDVYTRSVRGWALARSLAQTLTLAAVGHALQTRTPYLFHSDQGSQYAAADHTALLHAHGVLISMADKASPTQNAVVERFIRTLKEEHLDYTEYRDFDDALHQLQHWLEVEYMTERIHSALAYATPAEFEEATFALRHPPLFTS